MQENDIIYVTPKAYRLLYDACARSLFHAEGLNNDEKYVMLNAESNAIDYDWKARDIELDSALAETGESIKIMDDISNAAPEFVSERVHELLRKVRVADAGYVKPIERVFISDKTYRKMLDFIATRHLYYRVDDIDNSMGCGGFVGSYLELSLKKTEGKLRLAFEKSGANFVEFYDMFYGGDLDDNNRDYNIRRILRKYYPESMRETLEELGN